MANDGAPSYRAGVYGSGLCCATLAKRGIDPDATHPDKDGGLFTVGSAPAGG